MKKSFFLLLPFVFSIAAWHNNLNEAKQIVRKENKHILLNFSGSDWCIMHKQQTCLLILFL
jgi:hypothetical protein